MSEVTFDSFERAIHSGRLCLTVNGLQQHFNSVERTTNGGKCEVCGENSIWRCARCNKMLYTVAKRKWNGAKCLFLYHSPEFFGLARSDCTSQASWTAPTPLMMEKNERMIKRWMKDRD